MPRRPRAGSPFRRNRRHPALQDRDEGMGELDRRGPLLGADEARKEGILASAVDDALLGADQLAQTLADLLDDRLRRAGVRQPVQEALDADFQSASLRKQEPLDDRP